MASDEIDTNKAIIYANKRFPGDSLRILLRLPHSTMATPKADQMR